MVNDILTAQAKTQAAYLEYLISKAQELVNATTSLAFDPQGRVLVDVKTDVPELLEFLKNKKKLSGLDSEEELVRALGFNPRKVTTVSLDTPTLNNAFYEQLRLTANFSNRFLPIEGIIGALQEQPRGSIIALQQEFHFHLALVKRVYQKAAAEDPPLFSNAKNLNNQKAMDNAYQGAMVEVNRLVMAAYINALDDAYDNNRLDGSTLNIAKLNKALDKARKEITPKAHAIFMKEIVKNTGVILDPKELKKAKSKIKALAEETTATANDVLHTDHDLGLATLTEGSENTAHHRVVGTEFAHRQIITHHLAKDLTVTAHEHPRIQIRTPEPVVKKGLTEAEYIEDVVTKFDHITKKYGLADKLSTVGERPKAFIYNRYTALNDTLGDINGNLQTQSAKHIMQGVHRYNEEQLESSETPVLCFIESISVNGFGDTLGYNQKSKITEESTLMTEMALLHTLYEASSSDQRTKINDVFTKYKDFLSGNPREKYFSLSPEGQEAIGLIKAIKDSWKKEAYESKDDVFQDAQHSLKNLIAHDLHFTHDYAKLIQSLSVFVEEVSLGSCKSGNERTQAINGRVAILDAVLKTQNDNLTEDGKRIKEALADVARVETAEEAADELKSAIDAVYNKWALQAGVSIISLIDQGAAAKVEAKEHDHHASRNYGEEKSLTNLHQSKAGAMQAHKGLSKAMIAAWSGFPSSPWQRMKSKLGTGGSIALLASSLLILPIVGLLVFTAYSAFDNYSRKKATEYENFHIFSTEYHEENLPQDEEEKPEDDSNVKMIQQLGGAGTEPVSTNKQAVGNTGKKTEFKQTPPAKDELDAKTSYVVGFNPGKH
ncbi:MULTISPECIES: hypothetical protein [unclassified Legionella]|uniref:hypothetical protein n=1 Tax=unclassified Legionella TaxID=2622702 RepID=UPI0010542AB4|nr:MULTISPECIES: hypothetical protein [unclassified Legionella]MDI9819239.1 hypothetical protein [Legionella sp. PL877]